MSFRYTNSLIGALRHRILLEAAQRSIARKVFVGVCKGIEVKCSGFGAILSIQLRQGLTPAAKAAVESYYYEDVNGGSWQSSPATEGTPLSDTASSSNAASTSRRMLRLDKVQKSVKAATWIAQERRRSAKADAIHRSIHGSNATSGNSFSSSSPSPAVGLKHWFEDHPDVLPASLPHQHLTKWLATAWMTAVQYGVPSPDRFLSHATPNQEKANDKDSEINSATQEDEKQRKTSHSVASDASSTLPNVLSLPYCDPLAIPIGSIHALHTPSLMQFEQHYNAALSSANTVFGEEGSSTYYPPTLDSAQVVDRALAHRSRVCMKTVRAKQRQELCMDEIKFWERVELISGAQLASIKTGRNTHASSRQSSGGKRPYKELSQTLRDGVEEKVELRFTK